MLAALSDPSPGSGPDPPADAFGFSLRRDPDAPAAARQALLAANGALPAPLLEDVLLLVTELVTNSVRHATAGPEQGLRVDVRRLARRLRVEVSDHGTGFSPQRAPLSPDQSGGWGLLLVETIADRWGVERRDSGTCVWFELRHST